MLKKALCCSLILLVQSVYAGQIHAQSQATKDEATLAKVKQRVEKLNQSGKLARVKLNSGTKLKGYISQPGADSFVVTDKKGQKTTLPYAEVKEVSKSGGLSRTSKILIVSGVAVAVVVIVLAVSFARGFNFTGIGGGL